MLGVPIHTDGSDSQDFSRTVESLIYRQGLTLVEAMELTLPPIVDEVKGLPADLRGFYMYLRQAFGPFAQGPVALISRFGDEHVFSVDALGLRPLWQLETADAYFFSSEPGVVAVSATTAEPKPLAPGEKVCVEVDRSERRDHAARPRRDAGAVRRALARAHRLRRGRLGLRGRDPHRRPARGRRDPRLHERRPVRADQGGGPRAGRLRLAARGHEARAADGRHRPGADRLAGLRRPARLPLARAPEPGRLLQGVGGGGDQPGDRPRARGGALLLPRGDRRAALAARDRARAGHDRGRVPDPVRRPRRARPALRRDLPRDRPRAQDLPARGPLGGLPRPQRGARHLVPGVREHPGRDRAAQAGGHHRGPRRRRAGRALGPHRLRGRPPLPRSRTWRWPPWTWRCAST